MPLPLSSSGESGFFAFGNCKRKLGELLGRHDIIQRFVHGQFSQHDHLRNAQ